MTELAVRTDVSDLATRFWEGFLERQPLFASMLGDRRFEDRLDPSPEGRRRDAEALESVWSDAARIDPSSLNVEDRITLSMLRVVAEIGLAQHAQAVHEYAGVDHIAGPQGLPGDLARFTVIDGAESFEQLLARIDLYPAYLDAHVTNMRDGVTSGRTAARQVVERAVEQIDRSLAAPIEESPLLISISGLDDDQRARLRGAIERRIHPAQERYVAALRAYLPDARSDEGLWAIPGGEDAYRTAILASTTIQATPQELHDYGLEQVESIDRERLAIARQLGHQEIASLRTTLEHDPSNLAAEPGQLVELARAQIARAEALAPRWFGRLPRARCEVRAVEPYLEREAPAAYYFPPAADGSRDGIYYINTFQPGSRPLHHVASVTYHEAVPGHHFQLTIESELEELHPFRRFGSRLAGGAYTEGWGLYSERLADEMDLYQDPRERLGMLDMQAMRAARLVVDTGIHAFRWNRDRAAGYLERVGLPRLQAEVETDRYIVWPGQALSYMTGQREIQALRRELEARDGSRFDLRGFHDALLGHGSLPLATLRNELPNWVKPARR